MHGSFSAGLHKRTRCARSPASRMASCQIVVLPIPTSPSRRRAAGPSVGSCRKVPMAACSAVRPTISGGELIVRFWSPGGGRSSGEWSKRLPFGRSRLILIDGTDAHTRPAATPVLLVEASWRLALRTHAAEYEERRRRLGLVTEGILMAWTIEAKYRSVTRGCSGTVIGRFPSRGSRDRRRGAAFAFSAVGVNLLVWGAASCGEIRGRMDALRVGFGRLRARPLRTSSLAILRRVLRSS